MENLCTLVEIISELRTENKQLKETAKRESDSAMYWFKKYKELEDKETELNNKKSDNGSK